MRQVIAGAKATTGVLVALLVSTTIANAQAGGDDAAMAALIEDGENVFSRNCAVCHGPEGDGGEGPRFAGNQLLVSVSTTLDQVLLGGAYMPPFDGMSNDDIAAVATFIRNSWGNEFGMITADQVANYR